MFKKILVPVDLSDPDHYQDAVSVACGLAETYGAELRLLTVTQALSASIAEYLPEDAHHRVVEETQGGLKEIAAATGLAGDRVSIVVREGATHHEVLQEADDAGCDLIVMGSHKPGFATYFLGSHATTIVRHAHCSVMVLRSED